MMGVGEEVGELGSWGYGEVVTSCKKRGKRKKSDNNRFLRMLGPRPSGIHIYMYSTSQWNVVIGLKTGISRLDRRSTIT